MTQHWIWVTLNVALAAHLEQLAEHGGAFLALASGDLSEVELADWFRLHIGADKLTAA